MARAQVERWAAEHPTAPRTGRFFEVPLSYVGPRVAAGIALAGVAWWVNGALFWTYKPESLSPEFVAEAKRVGPVAVRASRGVSGCIIAGVLRRALGREGSGSGTRARRRDGAWPVHRSRRRVALQVCLPLALSGMRRCRCKPPCLGRPAGRPLCTDRGSLPLAPRPLTAARALLLACPAPPCPCSNA